MAKEWKERELAARIIDKYLRRLYVKAIMEGYDLLFAEELPGSIDDTVSLKVEKDKKTGMFQLTAIYEDPTRRRRVDVASQPEVFEDAKGFLNALGALIDSLPRCPHPELNEHNLVRLRTLLMEFKENKLNGHVFYSGSLKHNFINGPYTVYSVATNYYGVGETREIERALESIGQVILFLKEHRHEADPIDPKMLQHLSRCNDYLVFLEENSLLQEQERSLKGPDGLMYGALMPSLDRDIKESFPSLQKVESTAGSLSKLTKAEQRRFLEMRSGEPVSLSSETELDLSLSWADKIDHMKGALKGWGPVVKDTRDFATFLEEGILGRMICKMRAGDDAHPGVVTVVHQTFSIPPPPREILSTLLLIALHRTVAGGGQGRTSLNENIDLVSRGITEAISGLFREHMNGNVPEDVADELSEIRKKMKGKVARKAAASRPEGPGTMSPDAARKALANVARGLSEGLTAVKEQLTETHSLVSSALSDTEKAVKVVPGWTYDLRLDSNYRKDFYELDRLILTYSPTGLHVNFGNAASAPTLLDKMCEAILVMPEEGVVSVTPALESLIKGEGKEAGQALCNRLRHFAGELSRRQSEMREHYHQVLSRDFSEEFFEDYVQSAPGM